MIVIVIVIIVIIIVIIIIIREGQIIQHRLAKPTRKTDPANKAKSFAKLFMEICQMNSALRYLSDDVSGGVLPLTDDD